MENLNCSSHDSLAERIEKMCVEMKKLRIDINELKGGSSPQMPKSSLASPSLDLSDDILHRISIRKAELLKNGTVNLKGESLKNEKKSV
jgi:hypothetical protein